MAGVGPAPKPAGRRVRTNHDPIPLRVIFSPPMDQPALPSFYIERDGALTEFLWPARTVEWWEMWATSPLSSDFTAVDWDFLLDTAVLHARYWTGTTSVAAELRLRVAKYGATPEDRARLRITFAQADAAEDHAPAQPTSRSRRGPMTT